MYEVKDGKQVVPTCPECKCRLNLNEFEDMWYHFFGDTSTDARGCKCDSYGRAFGIVPKVAKINSI